MYSIVVKTNEINNFDNVKAGKLIYNGTNLTELESNKLIQIRHRLIADLKQVYNRYLIKDNIASEEHSNQRRLSKR